MATGDGGPDSKPPRPTDDAPASAAPGADQARMAFVLHLRERGIGDVNVLRALETIPRDQFVPRRYADLAWRHISLPIACGQIMPEPFVVARTMEALGLSKDHRVLELGAGSGYSTAIISRLAGEVVSIERYKTLAVEAEARLQAIGANNVSVIWADGLDAASRSGSFDRIVVHFSLEMVPADLLSALNSDGRIVYGRAARHENPAGMAMRLAADSAGGNEKFLVPVRVSAPSAGKANAL